MKAAVVLVNLGGPDKLENVQPFLFNLFSDPDIFKLPFGEKGQELFAGLISKYRAPKSAILYEEIGGSSPLHPNTLDQAIALQKTLREVDDFQVHVAQRYWHPLIPEVIEKLSHETFDKIVLLPLFPQYSNTTTLSVINEWVRHGEGLIAPIIIQRFHQHPKYIEACRERIKEKLDQVSGKPHLVFSAHSIPQSRVKQGDPYQDEIEETVELILEDFHGYGHSLCYQSRVGPTKWLEPNIKDELKELRNRGIKNLLVFPVAFVSEHLETLHELDIKYRKVAEELGFNQFIRVNTVQTHPLFIDCLKELVLENCQ